MAILTALSSPDIFPLWSIGLVFRHTVLCLDSISLTQSRCLGRLLQVRTSVHEVASPENFDLVKSILVEGKLCEKIVSAFEGYVQYLPVRFASVRWFVHVRCIFGNGSCRYDLQQDDVFQRAGYFGQLHLLAAELSGSDAEPVTAALAALEGEVAAGWAALSNEGCADLNLSTYCCTVCESDVALRFLLPHLQSRCLKRCTQRCFIEPEGGQRNADRRWSHWFLTGLGVQQ